jgi:hypothetical protein
MVGSVKPDHFEGEDLHPIVGRIPERYGQVDLPERYHLLSRHDAVERRLGRPNG